MMVIICQAVPEPFLFEIVQPKAHMNSLLLVANSPFGKLAENRNCLSVIEHNVASQNRNQILKTALAIVINKSQYVWPIHAFVDRIELLDRLVNVICESVISWIISKPASECTRRHGIKLRVEPSVSFYGLDFTVKQNLIGGVFDNRKVRSLSSTETAFIETKRSEATVG
jgi:hypothetical protein